jgi:hypothetical protein
MRNSRAVYIGIWVVALILLTWGLVGHWFGPNQSDEYRILRPLVLKATFVPCSGISVSNPGGVKFNPPYPGSGGVRVFELSDVPQFIREKYVKKGRVSSRVWMPSGREVILECGRSPYLNGAGRTACTLYALELGL